MSDWYVEHWHSKETPEFNNWWINFYGPVELYLDPEDYWIRKAFALAGWLARVQ